LNKAAKLIDVLRMNPKLIINFIYSIFINLFHCFKGFYRLKVIADFGSHITRAAGAKLQIDRRLYLGGKYIGDMSAAKAYLRMYKNSLFHVKGRVKLGPGVGVVTGPNARLTIGDNTYITASSVVYCANEIEIGSDCAIAWNTTIIDTDFHRIHYPDGSENDASLPIKIGDKVWIGCNCTILKGVTIGSNSVIGANTLVNRDIPANCLAAGNPVRIIREDVNWDA
jgi:acetyltransferase-like isoleucine patch superfamily enzyme